MLFCSALEESSVGGFVNKRKATRGYEFKPFKFNIADE